MITICKNSTADKGSDGKKPAFSHSTFKQVAVWTKSIYKWYFHLHSYICFYSKLFLSAPLEHFALKVIWLVPSFTAAYGEVKRINEMVEKRLLHIQSSTIQFWTWRMTWHAASLSTHNKQVLIYTVLSLTLKTEDSIICSSFGILR